MQLTIAVADADIIQIEQISATPERLLGLTPEPANTNRHARRQPFGAWRPYGRNLPASVVHPQAFFSLLFWAGERYG
jgi:hypothetical protein